MTEVATPSMLPVGGEKTVEFHARRVPHHTGVQLEQGQTYSFSVANVRRWVDFYIPSSPAGNHHFIRRVFDRMSRKRRLPEAPWYCLLGAHASGKYFEIGMGRLSWTCPRDPGTGPTRELTLTLTVNDVEGFDWNNWGRCSVAIKRIH